MTDWGKTEWVLVAILAGLALFTVIVSIGRHDAKLQCESIGGVPVDVGYRGTSVLCLNPEAIKR